MEKKNWWFDDSTSKIRAVIAYLITIVACLMLALKQANGKNTDSIIIFSVIVGFVILYFVGMALKAPVFGKNTIYWYRFDSSSKSEGVKMVDAKILSNYYGYSESESRVIVEQKETNRLLEEQNRLLNSIKNEETK